MDRKDIEFGVGEDRCAAWLYPHRRQHRTGADRGDGARTLGNAAGRAGAVRRALRGGGGRGAPLRPPRLRRQRRRARPVRAAAPARGLAGGDRPGALAAGRRPGAGGDLRLLDGRWQRTGGSGWRSTGRRSGQPGPVPRHGASGAPLLPTRRRADAAGRRPRRAPAGGRAAGRGGLHQRARRRGRLAPGGRGRRGLALAQPRLLALAAAPSLPTGAARRRAALSLAALRRRGRPGGKAGSRRSPRPDERRWASCAPTRASTTSTSTTAPSSRRSSPTRWPFCAATCWRPAESRSAGGGAGALFSGGAGRQARCGAAAEHAADQARGEIAGDGGERVGPRDVALGLAARAQPRRSPRRPSPAWRRPSG